MSIISFFLFYYCISQTYSLNHSAMKIIGDHIYFGGMNYLSKGIINNDNTVQLTLNKSNKSYIFNIPLIGSDIESDIGFTPFFPQGWPSEINRGANSLLSLEFDNCLNWKDENPDASVRNKSYDYYRSFHHTPSGQWKTMDYTCSNNFIRGIEEYDNENLWVCGTFGGFPRAYIVNKNDPSRFKVFDKNVMSCARYLDEPMATYRDKANNQLYVASGWGLYRPDMNKPDVPNNNSTMMYADWRLYRNLFPLPSTMAWVLSSDVNFINVVKDSGDYLYFFGHEVSNQYGLNNQEDRHAWQSFMVRICKKDQGYKYVPSGLGESLDNMIVHKYYTAFMGDADYNVNRLPKEQGYNKSWYEDQVHLPTTHFTTPLKINFGCYVGKRPRSISDNHFWGDTNVVYLNRLADVIFDPDKRVNFKTGNNTSFFGCNDNNHSQIPLIGLFNRPGMSITGVEPTGALCQLQINANIFPEIGLNKKVYQTYNSMEATSAFDEIMSLSSTSVSNFYSRSLHRTNGHTLYPYWNQGVLMGKRSRESNPLVFDHIGTCESNEFFKNLNVDKFLKSMNLSNTAWPNELANRLTSITSAVCQYPAAELYSFNATFIMQGVEFKRMFLIKDNITNYKMRSINTDVNTHDVVKRRHTSPLMVVGIISTRGDYYRVVLCDFDSAMTNWGSNHVNPSWYNWCIFRHTDQPYLYRQYTPMENRPRGENVLFRGSSLLMHSKLNNSNDYVLPNFHSVKEVIRQNDTLHVLTARNTSSINLIMNCASYEKCIDCASDPFCMWNIGGKKCENYEDSSDNDSNYIQDVLDRGFYCGTVKLKIVIIPVTMSKVLTLHCINSGFWRGPIVWKFTDGGVKIFENFTTPNGSYLTFVNYSDSNRYICCFGELDDYDTLYNGAEYTYKKPRNKKLNCFHIMMDRCIILIIIIILLIIVILLLLSLLLRRYISRKCCPNQREKSEINIRGDIQFSPINSVDT